MTISAANLPAFTTNTTADTSASAKAQAAFTASTNRGFDSGIQNTLAAAAAQFSTNPNYGQTTTSSSLSWVEPSGNLSKWIGVGATPATGLTQLR